MLLFTNWSIKPTRNIFSQTTHKRSHETYPVEAFYSPHLVSGGIPLIQDISLPTKNIDCHMANGGYGGLQLYTMLLKRSDARSLYCRCYSKWVDVLVMQKWRELKVFGHFLLYAFPLWPIVMSEVLKGKSLKKLSWLKFQPSGRARKFEILWKCLLGSFHTISSCFMF